MCRFRVLTETIEGAEEVVARMPSNTTRHESRLRNRLQESIEQMRLGLEEFEEENERAARRAALEALPRRSSYRLRQLDRERTQQVVFDQEAEEERAAQEKERMRQELDRRIFSVRAQWAQACGLVLPDVNRYMQRRRAELEEQRRIRAIEKEAEQEQAELEEELRMKELARGRARRKLLRTKVQAVMEAKSAFRAMKREVEAEEARLERAEQALEEAQELDPETMDRLESERIAAEESFANALQTKQKMFHELELAEEEEKTIRDVGEDDPMDWEDPAQVLELMKQAEDVVTLRETVRREEAARRASRHGILSSKFLPSTPPVRVTVAQNGQLMWWDAAGNRVRMPRARPYTVLGRHSDRPVLRLRGLRRSGKSLSAQQAAEALARRARQEQEETAGPLQEEGLVPAMDEVPPLLMRIPAPKRAEEATPAAEQQQGDTVPPVVNGDYCSEPAALPKPVFVVGPSGDREEEAEMLQ